MSERVLIIENRIDANLLPEVSKYIHTTLKFFVAEVNGKTNKFYDEEFVLNYKEIVTLIKAITSAIVSDLRADPIKGKEEEYKTECIIHVAALEYLSGVVCDMLENGIVRVICYWEDFEKLELEDAK